MKSMKLAVVAALLGATALAGTAQADGVKVGLLGGISGPIAAMAPAMIKAAELAIKQANEAGIKITTVVGDSGCDPAKAGDAATKAVNVEGVIAVVGPHCSGATIAAANTALIPAGVIAVSPSATAPTVTALADKDLVYRTVPSDSYQGEALARTIFARGTKTIAVTYLDNDYGKGLANAFKAEFEKQGGKVAAFSAHAGEKSSYVAELSELAKSGADTLAIFDYGDGAGLTILRQALENGLFKNFVGGDGMKSDAPIKALGADNLKTFVASSPVGEKGKALETFNAAFKAAGGDPDAIFVTTAYDAAALVALAVAHSGGDKAKMAASLRAVASAPGEVIGPGEFAKAVAAIKAGKDIDYQGAAGNHEFDKNGDVPGQYALFGVKDGKFQSVAEMK